MKNTLMEKVIIITGATGGIGSAIAEKLHDHKLILTGRNEGKLIGLEEKLKALGGKAMSVVADITIESDVKLVVDATINHFGVPNVLINNAGMGIFKRADEFSLSEFQDVINVNLHGTFLFTKYILPHMIKKKSGQIINISSVAGLNGFKSGTAYSASKFAVIGFTESLREDVKSFGIAVTAVCPGSVKTEFGGISLENKNQSDFVLEPSDVAHTIRYLVDESETANTKLIELKPRRKKAFR